MLHVFEIADGKITREQVWCDLAAIQQQLAQQQPAQQQPAQQQLGA
jgi:hypothetical protein